MAALVVANAILHVFQHVLGFGGIPIVATRIPHHGRQAKFLRDVQHAWPAAAERRPKPFQGFAGRVLEGRIASHKLLPDARGPFPAQIWMGHRMVPQQVTALTYGTDNFRTPAYKAANKEKGRTHLIAS